MQSSAASAFITLTELVLESREASAATIAHTYISPLPLPTSFCFRLLHDGTDVLPPAVFLRLGTTPLAACSRQRRSWLSLIHSGVWYSCV